MANGSSMQDFRRLIKANETSLSAHFAGHYQPTCLPLISSRTTSTRLCLHPRTIPWLNEVYQRSKITSEIHAQNRSLIIGITRYFPNSVLGSLARIVLRFDEVAIECLNIGAVFRIFDSRKTSSASGRREQKNTIRGMTTLDLASVSILLYSTSIHYTSYSRWHGCPLGFEAHAQTVFREMAFRYGPYFIWGAMFGSPADKLWIEWCILAGMTQLKAYEQGVAVLENVIPTQSIQSVNLREGGCAICRIF